MMPNKQYQNSERLIITYNNVKHKPHNEVIVIAYLAIFTYETDNWQLNVHVSYLNRSINYHTINQK